MTIDSLFSEQKSQLEVLISILSQEIDAIRSRQPEQLLELVKQRESCLQDIQQKDQSISQHPDLAAFKRSEQFDATVSELDSLIKQSQHLTAVNEKLVKQGKINVDNFRS